MFVRRALIGLAFAAVAASEQVCTSSDASGNCLESDASVMLQYAGKQHRAERELQADTEGVVHHCNHHGRPYTCLSPLTCCGGFCKPAESACCVGLSNVSFQCAPIAGGSECCGGGCRSPGGSCCLGNNNVDYPVAPGTQCEDALTVECANPAYGVSTLCTANSTCCDGICVAPGGVCCKNSDNQPFTCGAGSACCGNTCMDTGSHCCELSDGYRYAVSLLTPCHNHTHTRWWNPLGRSLHPASRRQHHAAHGNKHPWSLIEQEEPAVEIPELDIEERELDTETPVREFEDIFRLGWAHRCPINGFSLGCSAGMKCCHGNCIPKSGVCCQNVNHYGFGCGHFSSCCGNACAGAGSSCCHYPNNTAWDYPVAHGTICARDRAVNCPANVTGAAPFVCGENSTCCGSQCVAPGGSCNGPNAAGLYFGCGAGSFGCGDACAAPGNHCCDFHGRRWPVATSHDCPSGSTRVFTV